ncbi:Abortive infection bacteriophage resistance protein [Bhargavaea beijingensis]|uniref:Abortive infection bacteriophage resistance protein n=1 Tax=Bhargavaea beijingensis TaxID=426756 RepID=A0A1G7A5P8_9BACL|nr:Abi family protein [Bhargavaea beijingensis]SDE10081.1 Abortive infection bacteriophage resistance protein [Bhargavaea beijingensis]
MTVPSFPKPPKTYSEQVAILKSRNMIVADEEKAIRKLAQLNYYRLTAYALSFKEGENYREGTRFDHIVEIYEFDQRLRNTLMRYLEQIEINLRTTIAYHLAHTYGPLGYRNQDYFYSAPKHKEFLEKLDDNISKRSTDELFIAHHIENYHRKFPIWVSVEVLTFSNLSMLYSNLLRKDQLAIAKKHNTKPFYLINWLHSLSYLRNICAHYSRLYGKNLRIPSKQLNNIPNTVDPQKLFSSIAALCFLLPQTDRENFIIEIFALIENYIEWIELKEIGFPNDWRSVLEIIHKP